MINDTTQTQTWWESASMQQAWRDIINVGISYTEAKEIALSTFKENMPVLVSQAQRITNERVEEITESIMQKLEEVNSQDVQESLSTPGMQYAIYTAQKEYAKTWDRELSEVIQDILVERAKNKNRNMLQIVHDESLEVVSKLTAEQFDILSLIFLIWYTKKSNIINIPSLTSYLNTDILPFINSISEEDSCYSHLEFTSCATRQTISSKIIPIFKKIYWWLFMKWFTKEIFLEQSIWEISEYNWIIIPCIDDNSLFQVNTILEEIIIEKGYSDDIKNKIRWLYNNYLMSDSEIREKLWTTHPQFIEFIDKWDEWFLKSIRLTSVWIAIAHANLKRKTWIDSDLSMWIK